MPIPFARDRATPSRPFQTEPEHALRYPCAAMAVPKQKQSHARTAQRRAQHKMAAPVFNACPQCHSPRRPHRVCPVCGHYAGREVVAPTSAHDHHDH